MGCGASSLTRVEDYVPADDVSAGCVSHVSDQHLDDADIASLPSQKSSGEEATERPSLLKMKVAARVFEARMLHGINDDPNQFDEEPEKGPLVNRKQYASVAQFIDDHVQSIVRLELEEDTECASFDEANSIPGLSVSTSCRSSPDVSPRAAVPVAKPAPCVRQPSSHFYLPPATLRGHLDYDLLSVAAERKGTGSLPLGGLLMCNQRAIRQLSEVLAQRERRNPPLASQLLLAAAPPPISATLLEEDNESNLWLSATLLGAAQDEIQSHKKSKSLIRVEGMDVHWILSGKSYRQHQAELFATPAGSW